jgi:hypothetical protein
MANQLQKGGGQRIFFARSFMSIRININYSQMPPLAPRTTATGVVRQSATWGEIKNAALVHENAAFRACAAWGGSPPLPPLTTPLCNMECNNSMVSNQLYCL